MFDQPENPDVDLSAFEELAPDGSVTEIESPEVESEPTAEDAATQPTSRRNRAVEKGQRTPEPRVNLDDLPEFREWKSNMDRQVAEERRQRAELQQLIEQREQEALAQRAYALQQAIDQADDPDQQRRYVQEMANLQAAQQYTAWQKWEAHVRQRVSEEGLNLAEFNPGAYSGATGAAQFERDLAARKAAQLQQQIETYKQAADPSAIAKTVQAQVAKALQAAGLNAVDTGAPATPVNAANTWARDLALLQQGKLPPDQFKKRWGNR